MSGISGSGFALAGSGAVREHLVIERPTEDIDLFTSNQDVSRFGAAVAQVMSDLRRHGFEVEERRRAPQFARLHVCDSDRSEVDIDLGVDWREREPVTLEIGPVLSLPDAVGGKLSALYSRGEARDYLDVDAIRRDGRFSDNELITAAGERDPGFDLTMFARQLDAVQRLRPAQVARYAVSADELQAVKDRCLAWAEQLRVRPD